ncbi:MAG: ATP-binding protein, partial [Pseudonocardia sp.]|nr:ATP-binding protein [Pseudonocardia sp.]
TIEFLPATRAAAKARIALTGPSGAGKTYTGLTLGCRLAEEAGGRLAVIDTERGKSQMYKGIQGWDFDVFAPQSFSPASLTEALGVAAGHSFPVVLLDSWTHYWSGTDGMLEQVDRRAKGGNNFSGWKEARPDERRMIDSLVSYPGHVIVTLRVKTEYVIEANDKGKQVPRKVGLKPEQRDGMEYEFDVIGDLDLDNTLSVSKTRIPMLHGQVIAQPGAELAVTIADWLADGEDVPGPLAYRADALDPDATFDGLRELRDRVEAAGLMNAPVTDGDGHPTVLRELIYGRAKAMQPVRGVA